jgi:two-component system LytT family sensor kinase
MDRDARRDWMRRSGIQLALIFGVWTLIGVVSGFTRYVVGTYVGAARPFWQQFRAPLIEQWIWAALTPAVFFFSKRVPLSRRRLAPTLLAHCGFFLLTSLVHAAAASYLHVPIFVPRGFAGSPIVLRFVEEFYSDIWMYWPLVCIQALVDYYKRFRQQALQAAQLEARLARLQLELLRAQIKPHFLFNTLNSISALMQDQPHAAEDMLADLSEMFRASMLSTSRQEAALHHEIDLLRSYMRIQQRRFDDRLTPVFDIAPDALEAAIPTLLLQPLVENAVLHGIAPRVEPGRVEIRAVRRNEKLELHVSDNGVGMAERCQEGIGLSNTRERLLHLYGGEQSMEISSKPGQGTLVRIVMPFRIAPPEPEGEPYHEDSDAYRGRRKAGAAAYRFSAPNRPGH